MKTNLWNKKFNINEPACLQKWEWSTLYLMEQTSSSCHRVDKEDLSIENINNFHNTPGVLEARQKMLNGIWPGKGCEYCRDIELAGGLSDRQQVNNNEHHIEKLTPKEIIKNSSSIHVTPSTLEVYFSNLCNQACLYCFPKYSSKIESENRRYKPTNETRIEEQRIISERKKNFPIIKQKFWEWMYNNASSLKNYRILGGEPFYQNEIWENISFFTFNPCPDLDIQIFTNLNVDNERVRSILESFKKLIVDKHIKSLRLMMSIDSWGPAEEYVRSGSNNIVWKKNFDMIDSEFSKYFTVTLHSTLCNLNIKSAVDLVKMYNQSKLSSFDNSRDFALAGGHEYLHIGIFPKSFFDNDFDLLIDEISLIKTNKTETNIIQLEGFKKLTNSKPYRPDLIIQLKDYLDKIDYRRNMNWKETFPWLDCFNPDDFKE